MTTAVVIILIVAAILIAAYFARRAREKSIREFNRRFQNTYRLNRLTQQTFTKAYNIVADLVYSDGADIEVVYDNQVVFNGYMDRDDKGNEKPHFWYNKALLDKHGIEYYNF